MKCKRPARWERLLSTFVLRLGTESREQAQAGRQRGLLHVFALVEQLLLRGKSYHKITASGVLLYEIVPAPHLLRLPGEQPVWRGEPIISLHLDNRAVAAMARSESTGTALAWRFARAALADLQVLGELCSAGALPRGPRAVWAESILYRVFARYGFEIRAAPRTLRTPFARLYMLALLALYGNNDLVRLSDHYQDSLELGEAWMSVATLRTPSSRARRRVRSAHAAHAPDQNAT